MNWLDWVFLGLNTITYALGHYHGNNRGSATAAQAINVAVGAMQATQAVVDAQSAAAGEAAGAAAYAAGKAASKTLPPPKNAS